MYCLTAYHASQFKCLFHDSHHVLCAHVVVSFANSSITVTLPYLRYVVLITLRAVGGLTPDLIVNVLAGRLGVFSLILVTSTN